MGGRSSTTSSDRQQIGRLIVKWLRRTRTDGLARTLGKVREILSERYWECRLGVNTGQEYSSEELGFSDKGYK